MEYLETVETDVNRLQDKYDQAVNELGETWRELALEPQPKRRARLERQARLLTQAARELAGRVALASKALEQLRCRN